jgi:EmrB/QacA subfamily drug resistance transporter
VLQTAIVLFVIGSVLCGLSRSMGELIAFRALQGLGGGGLIVTTMAVVGDIMSPRERGRYQGIFGGVFGLSTVLGPLIGGFFVEHLSWRWIFYINVPFGLLVLAVIGWALTAPSERRQPKIDYAGAALLTIALTALVLFTSLGGHSFAWTSPQIIGMIAATVLGLIGFLFVEHHADEPILPLRLFHNRTFVVSCSIGFIVGVSMFGAVTFMPVYLQVAKGASPSNAGLLLTPMMAGVLMTSITSGQIISRIGRYRIFPIIGTAVMTVGLALLATLGTASSNWQASVYMLVLGLGLGMVMQVLVMAVQNAVDYRELGVATSGTTLFRSTDGSVGVSLFGAIFAASLASGVAARLPAGIPLHAGTDPAAIQALPADVRAIYLDVFTSALHPVFVLAAALSALAFGLAWLLKDEPLRGPARAETVAKTFASPRDATSVKELETILSQIDEREDRWTTIQRLARALAVPLAPDEIWLLVQLCRQTDALQPSALSARFKVAPTRIDDIARKLVAKELVTSAPNQSLTVTEAGRQEFERMIAAYRSRLANFLERWSPEDHAEVRSMLTAHARSLVEEVPTAPA